MDPRWKHPFPALVAGPTCCGKSQFVKRLLESGEDMIEGAPENIIWCYGIYQPAYDEIQRNIPNISFVEGVPSDLESMINPSIRNLVVIDDLMQELSNDQRITSLFTKGCHHRNLSVIFILQNIFHRGKELRDMSLNCHYLVLFKSPRDSSQVNHLAKQMFPGHVKYMQEAFQDATKRPYGYLLCDLKPESPSDFRLLFKCFITSCASCAEFNSCLKMNHTRRMILVPENTLERLQQRQQILTPPVTQTLKKFPPCCTKIFFFLRSVCFSRREQSAISCGLEVFFSPVY